VYTFKTFNNIASAFCQTALPNRATVPTKQTYGKSLNNWKIHNVYPICQVAQTVIGTVWWLLTWPSYYI